MSRLKRNEITHQDPVTVSDSDSECPRNRDKNPKDPKKTTGPKRVEKSVHITNMGEMEMEK